MTIEPYPHFHSKVDEVSKKLYEGGHFTDALRIVSTRLEEYCKEILVSITGETECSGQNLITKLFCLKQDENQIERPPVIVFYNLSTKDGRSKQESMLKMFSGFVGVIRNELAHTTTPLKDVEALYGLNIASYLFYKLEEAHLKLSGIEDSTDIEKVSTINSESAVTTISNFLLKSETFKSLKFDDMQNSRLLIKNILDNLVVDNLSIFGEDVYNFYFSSTENQEKIIDNIIKNRI